MKFLRNWGPALVWVVVISTASTGAFTTDRTAGHIIPILHWLFPSFDYDRLMHIHHGIRKCGHFFEYSVFALLVLRAFRAGKAGWKWSWAIMTLLVVASYAALDEIHQAFVPGRGASAWDSLLDTSGGAAALMVVWMWVRWRERRKPVLRG